MKLDELIAQLETLRAEHGNVDVVLCYETIETFDARGACWLDSIHGRAEGVALVYG